MTELKTSASLLLKLLENGAFGLLVQWTSLAKQINGSLSLSVLTPIEHTR